MVMNEPVETSPATPLRNAGAERSAGAADATRTGFAGQHARPDVALRPYLGRLASAPRMDDRTAVAVPVVRSYY